MDYCSSGLHKCSFHPDYISETTHSRRGIRRRVVRKIHLTWKTLKNAYHMYIKLPLCYVFWEISDGEISDNFWLGVSLD